MQPHNSSNPKPSFSHQWRFSYFGGTPEPPQPQEGTRERGFPLTEVYPGQRVRLLKVRGGKVQRLLKRGLVTGDVLTVLSIRASGSVIVAVAGQQIGLGAGIAQDLMVRDINESE